MRLLLEYKEISGRVLLIVLNEGSLQTWNHLIVSLTEVMEEYPASCVRFMRLIFVLVKEHSAMPQPCSSNGKKAR